uniref:Hydroxyproline-rich glycoprotein n=1 Tax=Rhizophora mucronata TaxID=61149 RepID=A0A2P2JTC2_RHIMU
MSLVFQLNRKRSLEPIRRRSLIL